MAIVASKSRDELIVRALVKNTPVIGAGQSPDAEDAACVNDAVDGVLADLAAHTASPMWWTQTTISIAWFEEPRRNSGRRASRPISARGATMAGSRSPKWRCTARTPHRRPRQKRSAWSHF